MKYLLLGLVINLVCFSTQDPLDVSAELEAIVNQCVTESGVNEALEKKFLEGLEVSDDPKFKCFLKCLAVNSEVMTEGGDVDFSTLAEIMVENELPRDTANKITKACEKATGSDACDTAYQVTTCMIQYAIDNKLLEAA